MEFLQITMIRPDMLNVPQHEFPTGYSLRPFRDGDGPIWVRVQQLAEPFYKIDQATFDKNFSQDLPAMPQRSFFLVAPDGSDAGTITAWYDKPHLGSAAPPLVGSPSRSSPHALSEEQARLRGTSPLRRGSLRSPTAANEDWGRIHWVCIVPQHQRKGLCRPMMTAAMNRLKALGHERAILGTQTPRLVAIKVYLDFGFVPDLGDDAPGAAGGESRRAWRLVKQELSHPGLAGI